MDLAKQQEIGISASLVAASWLDLKKTLRNIESSGIQMLHFDIEDGHFTPDHNLGLKIVRELRPCTQLLFDVHLMVENPETYLVDLVKIGVDRIAFHWEASRYPLRLLKMIKESNIKAGLAFNPATPIPDLEYLFPELDFVNLLSTEPVSGPYEFIPSVLNKLQEEYHKYVHFGLEWVIDGGVTDKNIQFIKSFHASNVVIGRYLFDGMLNENMSRLIALLANH